MASLDESAAAGLGDPSAVARAARLDHPLRMTLANEIHSRPVVV
jgi:hypothetical protein